jgi:hypothetical protein
MAEMRHATVNNTAHDATTAASYEDVGAGITIAAASLWAGADVLLIGGARLGGDNNATVTACAITEAVIGTITATEMMVEQRQATTPTLHNYGFVHRYTLDGTARDLDFQHYRVNGTGNAGGNAHWLIVLNLDDLNSSHFAITEQDDSGAPVAHTAALVDRASATISNCDVSDEILIIASAQIQVNNTTDAYQIQLEEGGATALLTNPVTEEGEDTAEIRQHLIVQRFVATGASHTILVQTGDDFTGTQHDHVRSEIALLNLTQLFESATTGYDATFTVSGTGAFEEALTINHTPDTTGDQIVLGTSLINGGATFREHWIRMQDDNGANSIAPAMDDGESAVMQGADDHLPLSMGDVISGTASTSQTIDFDVRNDSTTGDPWEDTVIAIFSTELPAAPSGGGPVLEPLPGEVAYLKPPGGF